MADEDTGSDEVAARKPTAEKEAATGDTSASASTSGETAVDDPGSPTWALPRGTVAVSYTHLTLPTKRIV